VPTPWIPSAEAFGTPTQILGIGTAGILSAEVFGTADITHSDVTLVHPTSISSAETFGTAAQAFVLGYATVASNSRNL
jgi:hypothetical protein